MSEEFIQINIPCGECLVRPVCENKDRIEKDMEVRQVKPFLLAIKKWDEKDKVWRKGLIEAWANMGWKILTSMRTEEFEGLPNHVRPEFLEVLEELSAACQWIINSTSWRDGQKHDFDKIEIERKLKRAIACIEYKAGVA